MGDKDIQYVEVPAWFRKQAGLELRHPASRWWYEAHSENQLHHFMKDVQKAFQGDLVPLQWVPSLVQVSRESVLRRAKSGGLTVISFVPIEVRRNLLGGIRERESRKSYDFAILSECMAWRMILLERAGGGEDE